MFEINDQILDEAVDVTADVTAIPHFQGLQSRKVNRAEQIGLLLDLLKYCV